MACLLLAGAAFRIVPLTDNRFHPDEALFSTLARLIASGRDSLLAHTSLLVDKPPLFYYTLAGAVIVAGAREVALRLPDLLFSMISLALAGRLSWRLWGSWAGACLTIALVALSPFVILFSPTVFSDPQYVMWLLAALVAVCERRWGWGGVLAGLALASKQSASFFLPLVVLLGLAQSIVIGRRPASLGREIFRFALGLILVLLLVVAWDQARAPAASFWAAAVQANNPGRLIRSSEVWPRAGAWLSWASIFTGSWAADGFLLALLGAAVLLDSGSHRPTRSGINTMILAAMLLAYVAAIWFVAFPLLDRYLLPVVYLLALLCGRGGQLLIQRVEQLPRPRIARITAAPVLIAALGALLIPGAFQAARSGYPVGGDHGAYAGIDRMAEYLSARPMGTVVYAHNLSWMLDYYLFDAYVYRAYFQSPGPLADDLRAFGGSSDERYLIVDGSERTSEISDAIGKAGYRLVIVMVGGDSALQSGLRLFRIEHLP